VPGATYDYRAAPDDLLARARRLEQVCASFGVPLRAAAARFPLTHPAVTSVLIGARNAAEITDALALRALDIPTALWDSLATGTHTLPTGTHPLPAGTHPLPAGAHSFPTANKKGQA
jgi:D-threo-aldose 1-dehydrogenase